MHARAPRTRTRIHTHVQVQYSKKQNQCEISYCGTTTTTKYIAFNHLKRFLGEFVLINVSRFSYLMNNDI